MHTSWTNSHNILRKQKSCVEIQPVTIRSRRPPLHKQHSVDYHHVQSKMNARGGLVISGQPTHQRNVATVQANNSQLQPGVGGAGSVSLDGSACTNANACAAGMKKRQTAGNGMQQETLEAKERHHLKKTASTGREEKIVLQISLAPVNLSQEFDGGISEVDSPRASPQLNTISGTSTSKLYGNNKENLVKRDICCGTVVANGSQNAAQRRAQFHASRASECSERKPGPMVRAMSAPIRSFDESSKNIQSKRKLRRRKIGRERDDLIFEANEEDDYLDSPPEKPSNPRKSISFPRSRSSLGCDIETLVSLFSSGGSDSEREDSAPVEIVTARAPMLRKNGKSVSFQEEDIGLSSFPRREFPAMLRRGSIAPLAARIRANRPPTAPPGSIYKRDYDKSGNETVPFSVETVISNSADAPKINPIKTDHSTSVDVEKDDGSYPDNIRSIKERECWKLFQKMSAKGIAVTYETILRGMLTPTELRAIQKQREREEKAIEHENAAIAEVLANEANSKF